MSDNDTERLRAGGCARDQRTTQFCAEAVAAQKEIERLRAENERLREQLYLANIDAVGAHGDANELRSALSDVVSLTERLIDTRRCAAGDLRVLNAARSALKEAAP